MNKKGIEMIKPKAKADWWQYSKWVYNIGRSLRANPPSDTERLIVEEFIQVMANPDIDESIKNNHWCKSNLKSLC